MRRAVLKVCVGRGVKVGVGVGFLIVGLWDLGCGINVMVVRVGVVPGMAWIGIRGW